MKNEKHISDIISEDLYNAIDNIRITYKPVCANLDKIALRFCENVSIDTAFEHLDFMNAILSSKNLVYHIGNIFENDEVFETLKTEQP